VDEGRKGCLGGLLCVEEGVWNLLRRTRLRDEGKCQVQGNPEDLNGLQAVSDGSPITG
jgi:hypothetical protein